jgi:hypothetical protein
MGLDIRLPIGMMFSLLGAALVVYGLITGSDTAMYQASLGYNINLWWGLVLMLFGGGMLFFALRDRNKK